jgi:hypothetical protein
MSTGECHVKIALIIIANSPINRDLGIAAIGLSAVTETINIKSVSLFLHNQKEACQNAANTLCC